MNDKKDTLIDSLLGKMTLEQKVGQLFVFGFCGPVITPDVVELITKYHLGGLRISQKFRKITIDHDMKPGSEMDESMLRSFSLPSGNNRDFAYPHSPTSCAVSEYAAVLNRLRGYALDRNLAIPLHFTIDQEGSASDDLLSGQRLFPQAMGYVAAGDPELAYRAAYCTGLQARAVGANMIHSPVLDVNTNPLNPEIGTRAYSDNPRIVAKYALRSMKGFQDAGLITTGKHFPGRGESQQDAHWTLPSVDLKLEELRQIHIYPYEALIQEGLDAVMVANCCYPALDPTGTPACMSPRILKGFLREQLGFDGIITTDNMMMGAILKTNTFIEAGIKCLNAGCDLILYRDESPMRIHALETIVESVKKKTIKEYQIDESVRRILEMRLKMGLFQNGGMVDVSKAGVPFNDPMIIQTATEAAEKTVLKLRDRDNLLPIPESQKVLLIEQIFPTHAFANNMYSHPGLLWEQMCQYSHQVASVEINYLPTGKDVERVLRRLPEADIIVMTNYYYHKAASSITELVQKVRGLKKNVIIVTNTIYEFGAHPNMPTVITCFNPGGYENMLAVAKVLYGKLQPTARSPIQSTTFESPLKVQEVKDEPQMISQIKHTSDKGIA